MSLTAHTLDSFQNDQFQNTGTILGTTMQRFKVMAAKEGGMFMCYMVVFIVFVVMLFYYFFFR